MKKRNLKKMLGTFMSGLLLLGVMYVHTPVYAEEEPDDYELTGYAVEISEEDIPESSENVGSLYGAELTEEAVYNSLISMRSVYPEGMTWTNANSYSPYYHYVNGRRITYTGYGCAGFAFHLSNAAFGSLEDREHYNWDDIRVGDILRVNNDNHSVIVLNVNGDTITVAEGNYNSSIHWGRQISRTTLKNGMGTYIWTRWPEGSVSTSQVSAVSLSSTSVATFSGDSFTLTATVTPSSATNKNVIWSSNNQAVCTVNSNGVVTAIKNGTAVITCKSVQNSSIYATCTVTVKDATQVEGFVTRLYNKVLDRNPDSTGLNNWKRQLLSGTKSGAEVAYGFVFSQEYLNRHTSNEDYVEMLYNVFLDRGSDAGGKATWLAVLNDGMSREYVFRGFAQSNEFSGICNNYGIVRGSVALKQARDLNPNLTRYVNRLYNQLLGRNGDEQGLNTWCANIQEGKKTPEEVALSFLNSKEFKGKNLNNSDYVKTLYRTFLGREYDQQGYNNWMTKLNNGTSRDDVARQFAGSQEFKKIVKSFGL